MTHDDSASAVKVSIAWGGVAGAHLAAIDWQQVAGFVATAYTVYVFAHSLWRHFIRGWAEKRGWIKPLDRTAKIIEAIEEADGK